MFALFTRYPESLDSAIEHTLAKYAKDTAHLDILRDLMTLSPGVRRHQLLQEAPDTSLVLGLHHPQAGVRLLALRQLTRGLASQQAVGGEVVIDRGGG